MGNLGKKFFVLGLASTIAFSLTGCDLFSPKKEKKEEASTAAVTNPVVTAQPQDQGPLPADVVVRVGDWKLTNDEFNQRLKLLKQGLPDFDEKDSNTKVNVLNELIRQQLLVKDAEGSDIAQKKDIKDAVEDFRRTLLVQELANRITKAIVVNEDEARKYYDDNKNLFIEPVKYKVRQIVVDDEAAANALLVQILQGGDFDALAKAQSKDKTAAQGGVLPEFVKAPFEAMQKAIATVDAGKTSAVFKGPQGYYIVRVEDKKGGVAKPFADLKKDLMDGLTMRKQQSAILEYIDKLSQKTKVEVNNELLGIKEKK